jgi:hypothetical protein
MFVQTNSKYFTQNEDSTKLSEIHIYINMYMCMYVCTHACMYVCVGMCVCMYVYMYGYVCVCERVWVFRSMTCGYIRKILF